ncbi:MAG: ACP S-malonyltransferase [Firmicutes bacterium]|uniref:Malonyl CoA-acyl carrier protein transacylase n=1 Tax=Candidatus Scybalomonas excrementavium TaxID=2840943 RepID=A0A9D9I182_9FIRM|nr:ACP S-malonyltransferase [Candidatus Scybalomonas excrementavium]
MSKVAFMFPGQGSQYVGMGQDFYEQFEESKEVFESATKLLGFSMEELCFEENEQIHITEYTQAAMLTASTAILRKVESMGIKPDYTIGLSLGEYNALVASKVLSFEEAVQVVRQRGILMQNAVPVGLGTMAAVLGAKKEFIEQVCEDTEGIVGIANYNCPGQIVISGEVEAVKQASEALKEQGVKRVIPLKVSGPFHSKMLEQAGQKLLEVLDTVELKNPEIPYVANVNAQIITKAQRIKELLAQQVASSVRFEQSIERLIEEGVTTFIEMGPGKTLSGFVKKINRNVNVIQIEKVEDLEKLKEIVSC